MTANEIRKKFLDFFASKKHTLVPSDSLIPKDDPTVLFTTAGMQQFKRQFLGATQGYTRAASCQKCLRTDDLEKIGQSDCHHTFFEMLGNFSFGDYFKKEAIEWGWEFFTKTLKIPTDKLWVSIYKDDKEAKDIWLRTIKIAPSKIVALGDHSNFWPADAKEKGPNGPCGPCSEIFYDYGANKNCSNKKCDPSCDCGRFAEIWNLVFTQFNRKEGGVLEPLPNKNIDTGMGLERLAAVIQGKKSNYETDLFEPIIEAINRLIKDKQKISRREIFMIADHIRAIVFGLNDGVVPSNEGRGYVIKKLIIDAADIVLQTGQVQPTIYKLVPAVVAAMKEPYPDLVKNQKEISDMIQHVESAYIKVRKERLPDFKNQIADIKNKTSDDQTMSKKIGEVIFTFRDTYGLATSTIKTALSQINLSEPVLKKSWDCYTSLMAEQQKQSRASSKMTGEVFSDTDFDLNVPKTQFTGYEHAHATSTILALFIQNTKVNETSKGDSVKVILDRTPFYAEAGGQIGDSGFIIKDNNRIRITDTQKKDDVFIHIGTVEEGVFQIDDQVKTEIDVDRRLSIMRNHTATHLLQMALRDILGVHVKQQGSYVGEDRLRFDFTHPKALTDEQKSAIENLVNVFIRACDSVTIDFLPIEEAKRSGALAFFAEKYGDIVRVVSIGNYSKEFCGGTHLNSTGQIGIFKITQEGAVAQGIRRIESKTGIHAINFMSEYENQLKTIADTLKSPMTEIVGRVKDQANRLKQLENDIERLRFENIKHSLDALIENREVANGTTIISHTFKDVDIEALKKIADHIRTKFSSSVLILGATQDTGAAILISLTDDLVKNGLRADAVVKEVAPLIGGSGGGRPQLAQAGSKDTRNLEQALREANSIIKKQIKT